MDLGVGEDEGSGDVKNKGLFSGKVVWGSRGEPGAAVAQKEREKGKKKQVSEKSEVLGTGHTGQPRADVQRRGALQHYHPGCELWVSWGEG